MDDQAIRKELTAIKDIINRSSIRMLLGTKTPDRVLEHISRIEGLLVEAVNEARISSL